MLASYTAAAQRDIWSVGAYGNTAALAQAISRGITKAGAFLDLSCVPPACKPASMQNPCCTLLEPHTACNMHLLMWSGCRAQDLGLTSDTSRCGC